MFSDKRLKYFLLSVFHSVTFILNPQKRTIRRVRMARFECFEFNLCLLVYVLLISFLNISIFKSTPKKNHLEQKDYFMMINKREVTYLKDILLTAYNLKQLFRYKISYQSYQQWHQLTMLCYFFFLISLRMMTFHHI